MERHSTFGIRFWSNLCCLIIYGFSYIHAYGQCSYSTNTDTAQYVQCPALTDEVLVFEDDFNGNRLDLTKWEISTPYGEYTGGPENSSLPYPNNNVTVFNGFLTLTTLVQPGSVMVNGVNQSYGFTSGEISTRKLFGAGRFEIRCQLTYSQDPLNPTRLTHLNPAFWLFGQDCSQEIDCFEFLHDNVNELQMTHHKQLNCTGAKTECHDNYSGTALQYADNFHTFSVDFDDYTMIWKVDGVVRRKVYKYTSLSGQLADCNYIAHSSIGELFIQDNLYPSLNVMSRVIIDMMLQGGGPLPQDLPRSFVIDYVKAWKYMDCHNNDLQLSEYFPNANNTAGCSDYVGKHIMVAGGGLKYEIPGYTSIDYVALNATDRIDLLPGFHADYTSFFNAKIIPGCSPISRAMETSGNRPDAVTTGVPPGTVKEQFDMFVKSSLTSGQLSTGLSGSDQTVFNKEAILSIYNMMGQVIYQKSTILKEGMEETFDLSSRPHGIYLVEMKTTDKTFTKKIVFQ